jgi:DNA polymerase-3 subunit delta
MSELKNEKLKQIYFLFGEDHFTINNAIKNISKLVEPFLTSDFDYETISAEKKANLSDLIDLAYTFPFGSDKKLLIVKNFENYNNKKQLLDYINDPSETTILLIANYGTISNLMSEPYKSLKSKEFIFEARELKGAELENWVKKRASQLGFNINPESVKAVVEIVGEDKSLLEMQLQKFSSFIGDKKEIDVEDIKKLSSATKEYSIFDLLNALGRGNLASSYKVINNLLDNGKDLIFITNMLTKYISVIAQSIELQNRKLSDNDACKAIGVSKYYYINCKNASYLKNAQKLETTSKALYNVDLAMKTTSIDQKTLSTILVTEIFS